MDITITGDNVNFTWVSDNGEHEGLISLQWLKQNCYSEETLDKKRMDAKPTVAPKVFGRVNILILSSITPGTSP